MKLVELEMLDGREKCDCRDVYKSPRGRHMVCITYFVLFYSRFSRRWIQRFGTHCHVSLRIVTHTMNLNSSRRPAPAQDREIAFVPDIH